MSNRQRLPEELAFNRTVGSNIKYLRKTRNLNQSKVAAVLAVSFQQIQKYEKGANGICALKLKQLADFFKVGLDVLVDPNMITKHRGFTGDMDWIVGNNQNPQVLVGSLEEIKDKLKSDGIDPEETILPTLRNEKAKQDLKRRMLGDLSFDASKYEEFEDEYPAPLSQLEHDPKMRATYDAILEGKKNEYN